MSGIQSFPLMVSLSNHPRTIPENRIQIGVARETSPLGKGEIERDCLPLSLRVLRPKGESIRISRTIPLKKGIQTGVARETSPFRKGTKSLEKVEAVIGQLVEIIPEFMN